MTQPHNLTHRAYMEALADAVLGALPGVHASLYLAAESSDFIRFNHAQVRQATHVTQAYVTLSLAQGQRAIQSTRTVSGDLAIDVPALLADQLQLASDLACLPPDPYLLLPDEVKHTTREDQGALPQASEVIDAVHRHASGLDFVGFYAGGPVVRAYADSRGQRNWHRVDSFNLEWCLYHATDKAVKTGYSGTHWSEEAFAKRMQQAAQQVQLLARPPQTLSPGRYRAYFEPTAVGELLATLAWGGFSRKLQETGTSPLMRLVRGEAALHASVQLSEHTGRSSAPAFTPSGFTRPERVALVTNGLHAGSLCSPRSAREYGVLPNGATAGEAPEALYLAPGQLPEADALKALGTGLYLSNLHYLNYSDRQTCRLTGMTRFACFWVEDGQLKAPLNVMRFDDDLLALFGPRLLALTDQTQWLPDTSTYGERQLSSITTPGMLVDGFELTL
ncbi:MAG: metallopeptidase TldD-related protein [Aquabacterium sp.]|nr:metallopeptidase TldD-related protein [Aquabacterium sp.]